MKRPFVIPMYFVLFAALAADGRGQDSLKGAIIYPNAIPTVPVIAAAAAIPACIAKGAVNSEVWVIDPKTKGIKNVVVWIEPAGAKRGDPFPVALIGPKVAKVPAADAVIDQPCCLFEPRVLAVRAGQNMVIKNSAVIAHNANWTSGNNGAFNQAIASGGQLKLAAALVGEKNPITLACNVHGWMNAYIRVFDHPYFAVTDKDGKFEIPAILLGNYTVYMWHETGWIGGRAGAKGMQVKIVAGVNDLKEVEWKFAE